MAYTIDVYGTSEDRAAILLQKYGSKIEDLSNLLYSNSGSSFTKYIQDQNLIEEFTYNKSQLIDCIQKEEGYLWADIAIIYYDQEHIYITIDVVEPTEQHRLTYFRAEPNGSVPISSSLMQVWDDYEKVGLDLFFSGQLVNTSNNCPVWHCMYGFENPELKSFEKQLTEIARAQSEQLIKIINIDQNAQNRAKAVFLMGHLADPNLIIQSLIPLIYDPNQTVRNNAMRVMGAILERHIFKEFPIEMAIQALDFPNTTDRNKALYMLSSLANHPKHAVYIKQHANIPLQKHLALKQPNLHNLTEEILKKIDAHS